MLCVINSPLSLAKARQMSILKMQQMSQGRLFSLLAVPHVRIQGSPDIHVDQGSVINLTCIISSTPEPPVYVFWYHGEKVLCLLWKLMSKVSNSSNNHFQVVPYDSAGGRIEVFTSKGRETKSNLVIKKAGPSDSGNYTCKPSIAREASIKVHVLESKLITSYFRYIHQAIVVNLLFYSKSNYRTLFSRILSTNWLRSRMNVLWKVSFYCQKIIE